jgi:hypothetical protein
VHSSGSPFRGARFGGDVTSRRRELPLDGASR